MNDLHDVRALYDDPPAPSAHTVAAARRRMVEGPGRTAVPRRRRGLAFGLGAVAVGAAAAVAVAVLPGGGVAPSAPEQEAPEVSPQTLLLAAAERAAKEPASGSHWYYKRIDGSQAVVKDKGYLVDRRVEKESWIPTSAREYAWTVERPLSVKPLGPADEAAWRRDGSPTSWKVLANIGGALDGRPFKEGTDGPGSDAGDPVTAGPGEPYAVPDSLRPGWLGTLAAQPITPPGLRKLPGDPVALKATLEKRMRPYERRMAKVPPADSADNIRAMHDDMLFHTTLTLLTTLPAPPKVRAAAFRMLATLPGVQNRGKVTDALGRKGQAVAYRSMDDTVEQRVVVDPATGRLLAVQQVVITPQARYRERPGQVRHYSVLLEAKWSDKGPVLPAKRYMVDKNGNPEKPTCARC
ncbi:CU044_5270 family protein [Actinomadura hibisca]|uniref:CU044_5270 family protein n=1 Tax=Actinomadura hibisca TaxID=68565 RepID=UPI0008327A78|nr:CU044_5270 family protein [Actinomadura hibisca]